MGAEELAAGDRVTDRYELEERLGRGGMGEVWRARHLALNSHVAIKFLHAASAQKEVARKRFLNEAQVTAQLKSRHAVQVFDFGVTDLGQPYLVMEMLDGETIGHRLERSGRLPRAATVRFLQQAARALDRAHAMGIVHRDFKPDNLVIVKDDDGKESIKVLDFGIAKLIGDIEAASTPSPGVPRDDDTLVDGAPATVTQTNQMLGTPHYMAPEQIRREVQGPPTDVWAFGVVAFECLTGSLPFDGNSLIDIFTRIQMGRHLSPAELAPDLPAEFGEWFDMACAVKPADRFSSATVAARALAVSLESGRWDRTLDPRPLEVSGSTASLPPPALAEGSSENGVPRPGLGVGSRLKARRPRTFGDTHEPVSRPLDGSQGGSSGPLSPAVAPRASGAQVTTVKRRAGPPLLPIVLGVVVVGLIGLGLAWRAAAPAGPSGAAPASAGYVEGLPKASPPLATTASALASAKGADAASPSP